MAPELAKKLCKAFAVIAVVTGGAGMALCVPILLTYGKVSVLATVSLPLIAGAVLVGSGLTAFAILIRE
ncbi:MAG: hypothetical protein KAR05_01885 [Candidatus Omnitrophica bacterium]|nr:hypothetical protein [Candidatus Omnitrophota bacterium]